MRRQLSFQFLHSFVRLIQFSVHFGRVGNRSVALLYTVSDDDEEGFEMKDRAEAANEHTRRSARSAVSRRNKARASSAASPASSAPTTCVNKKS